VSSVIVYKTQLCSKACHRRPVHVGFVVDKVTMRQILNTYVFVCIIQTVLHAH